MTRQQKIGQVLIIVVVLLFCLTIPISAIYLFPNEELFAGSVGGILGIVTAIYLLVIYPKQEGEKNKVK